MSRHGNKVVIKLLVSFLLSLTIVLVIGGYGLYYWNKGQTDPDEPVKETIVLQFEDESNEEENEIEQEEEEELGELVVEEGMTFLFGGDILLDPQYAIMANILQRENGILDSVGSGIVEEMVAADVCVLNNEFPYTLRGEPIEEKTFTFRANPEYAKILHDIGVDLVSLANNHTFDYGEISLLDSLKALDDAGIDRIGAGVNIEEASKPIYYSQNGVEVGIVAATAIEGYDNPDTRGATATLPGVFRSFDPTKLVEKIIEMKEVTDVVIVFVHWGDEGVAEPKWLQIDHAKRFVEAGADLIVGAHSHCMQTIDYIDGVPVIYSLGNFLFSSKAGETALLKVEVEPEGIKSLSLLPAKQSNSKVYEMSREEELQFYEYMMSISPNIIIRDDGKIENKLDTLE